MNILNNSKSLVCLAKQCQVARISFLTKSHELLPFVTRTLSRSLAVMSTRYEDSQSMVKRVKSSSLCGCGCGIHGMHTRGDRELVEFLQEEISEEKKSVTATGLPATIGDFNVKASNAELVLTRKFNDEEITVTLNVNHTVDAEEPAELSENPDGSQSAALKSTPSFEVDIKVGAKVLSFTCTFHSENPSEGEAHEDVFGINEVTIYEGEWSEEVYCVSGDILDGMLYDLLMNMLEERGITTDFAHNISSVCTSYEHNLYINLLQKMQDFVKRK